MTVHAAGISDSTHLASGLLTAARPVGSVVTLVLALQDLAAVCLSRLLTGTLASVRFGFRRPLLGRLFRYRYSLPLDCWTCWRSASASAGGVWNASSP